jgi:hypothetical protein
MEYILTLNFICANDSKSSIVIEGVKQLISDVEVANLMDTILAKDIFLTKNGNFKGKDSAHLTQRAIRDFDLQA